MFLIRLAEEGGPNTELAWLLWVALGFFFLMVIIGWLTSRRNGNQPEVRHEAHAPAAHKEPDDLTALEGIGPKVAKVLNGMGITTFAELAHANAAEVQNVLNAAGLQMMNPEGWIEQAKLAAKGDMDALKKMQDELKGGRKK